MKEGKRGQVTIFIILAIIIVAGIATFFMYVKPTLLSEKSARVGFDGCIQDEMETILLELEENGGFISPEFSYKYMGVEYSYFCYSNQYYDLCTVQVPFVASKITEQLKIAMKEKVSECYLDSISELKDQGYEVVSGDVSYQIFLEQGKVVMEIQAPTTVGSQSFVKFNVELDSPVQQMSDLATSIIQYETTYGDSDLATMSIYYPDYKMTKLKMSEGTTLYTIESKIYGDKLQFASRSLAFPAGYDI